jgi:hypothetical protein
LFFGVTMTDAKQDDQSVGDFCNGPAVYGHFSGFDSLDEGAHEGLIKRNT